MRDWGKAIRSRLGLARDPSARPEVFQELRSIALGVDLATIAVEDGRPWSGAAVAVMEMNVTGTVATIVATADGGVSMYLSSGGGVIGAGGHAAVQPAAERFRNVAADSRGLLQAPEGFPLPEAGQVRFHVRTDDGEYSGSADEVALRSGRHPLSPLYAAGQDLLTEIRLATPS
jgi:hypothetical protein